MHTFYSVADCNYSKEGCINLYCGYRDKDNYAWKFTTLVFLKHLKSEIKKKILKTHQNPK